MILDVNNVGYKIFSNVRSLIGDEQEFFIHERVREDADDLYGFLTVEEMEFFELLLTVSGIGPKAGLNILTIGSIEKIRQSIVRGDTTLFTTVPGIGKKVAAKIIVELKNKVVAHADSYLPQASGEDEDLVDALEQLGYKQAEIFVVLKEMPVEVSGTQDKLTWALQKMKR